jgi:hypothetical protein
MWRQVSAAANHKRRWDIDACGACGEALTEVGPGVVTPGEDDKDVCCMSDMEAGEWRPFTKGGWDRVACGARDEALTEVVSGVVTPGEDEIACCLSDVEAGEQQLFRRSGWAVLQDWLDYGSVRSAAGRACTDRR